MAISTFSPASPDAFLVKESDMSLAKFGHINAIVNELNTKAAAITTATTTATATASSFSRNYLQ